MNTQEQKGRAESLKRPALTAKRDRAFVGAPTFVAAAKTSATAEAGSKKGQFYKPSPKEFQRGGFNYRQIAREGDIAIYEQVWTGCAQPSRSYQLIRIRRRDGFQIGSRFIPPAEVYPRSQQWGELGWTFCDKEAAFAKLRKISATTGGGG